MFSRLFSTLLGPRGNVLVQRVLHHDSLPLILEILALFSDVRSKTHVTHSVSCKLTPPAEPTLSVLHMRQRQACIQSQAIAPDEAWVPVGVIAIVAAQARPHGHYPNITGLGLLARVSSRDQTGIG